MSVVSAVSESTTRKVLATVFTAGSLLAMSHVASFAASCLPPAGTVVAPFNGADPASASQSVGNFPEPGGFTCTIEVPVLNPEAVVEITGNTSDIGGLLVGTPTYDVVQNGVTLLNDALLNDTDYTLSGPVVAGTLLIIWTGVIGPSTEPGLASADYTIAGVSQIPLPGALVLFGSALAGLGLLQRRRKYRTVGTAV